MAIDKRALRDVLGTFVTGVTVMTTVDSSGRLHGCTANSFSSVSLEPPLVLWSQGLKARSYAAFAEARRFAVNILAEDQREVSQRFASDAEDKFGGVAWQPGIEGVPVLEGCSAYLECRKAANYPGGDHTIFLGEVENLQRAGHTPLVFGGGRYMLAFSHELGGSSTSTNTQGEAVRVANVALADICARLGISVGLSVWGNRGPTTIRFEHHPSFNWDQPSAGRVVSLLNSVTGRVFLAYLPAQVVQPILDEELAAERSLGYPVPSAGELQASCEEVRARGMARVLDSRVPEMRGMGVASFAVPIFDRNGQIVLALTGVARAARIDTSWDGPVARAVSSEAALISRRLGFTSRD